ncbi:(2Fe-2S) ferredoxin domain-containing protein [Alkalihalobacterium elongatum]|uniref:(2Fe-2S) ferredoxin domain-containing protein n=1 Tax=Alkalihalobacterium elongatum TaxID=2675466 RepID=UPI001C20024F|nr:(2Fe-2S) ferredoxin domain-containing protein [Alkalihalobacterium elongatum]
MATWDLSETKHHLLICNGSSCNKAGAEDLTQAVRSEISERGLDDTIHTTRTKCNGRCQDKCVLIAYPEGVWYKDLAAHHAPYLIDSLVNNVRMTDKISHYFDGNGFKRQGDIPVGEFKDRERVKKVSKVM